MTNRYPNEFSVPALEYMNSIGQTYHGYTLNFTDTELLGYPPTPIPQTGAVYYVGQDKINDELMMAY